MKYVIYFLIAVSAGLMIYNLTFLDFGDPVSGESTAALIGVLAAGCVILLMLILLVSRAIAKKAKK